MQLKTRACWALVVAAATVAATPAHGQGSQVDVKSEESPLADHVDLAAKEFAELAIREARRRLAAGDYPGALRGFLDAYELQKDDPDVALQLSALHERLGNLEQAKRFARIAVGVTPARPEGYTRLAHVLLASDELEEARTTARRAREVGGNQPAAVALEARIAAQQGEYRQAEALYRQAVALAPPDDVLRLEIGDFYRNFGRAEQARDWYAQIEGPLERQASQRLFDLDVQQEARRLGFDETGRHVPAAARAMASRGRIVGRRGDYEQAEQLLRDVLRQWPHFAEARADLADVLRARGAYREAELAYVHAVAVAPAEPELAFRLAEYYLSEDGAVRAGEAALFFSRVVRDKPEWTEARLRLAKALQLAGDFRSAYSVVQRVLSENPNETDRSAAFDLRKELEPLVRTSTRPTERSPTHAGMDARRYALARARAHLSRGAADAALVELRRLGTRERTAAVLNLEAAILQAANRPEAAVEALEASLRLDQDQAEKREHLGLLLARRGDVTGARRQLEWAARQGRASAALALSKLEVSANDGWLGWARDLQHARSLWRARKRLRSLEQTAEPTTRARARSLRRQIDRRLITSSASALGVFLVLGGLSAFVTARRWGGASLRTLLAAHPDAGTDVHRILSAVRHEVLKHNTLALGGLIEALAREEPVQDRAMHLDRSLFGADGKAGALAKFHGYIRGLEKIGRAHDVRLNLAHRDTAIGPIVQGMRLLHRSRSLLRSTTLRSREVSKEDRLPKWTKRWRTQRLLGRLSKANRKLNQEGYQGVQALLARIRTFDVDLAVLERVFDRIRSEPAFDGADIAAVEIETECSLPVSLRIPRTSFEDVLANLIRNALQVSLRHKAPVTESSAVQIGIAVKYDVEPITGIGRISLEVRDCVAESFDEAAFSSRYIERGLGLAADLATRYDGTVRVQPARPPWEKAVVFELPEAERTSTSNLQDS